MRYLMLLVFVLFPSSVYGQNTEDVLKKHEHLLKAPGDARSSCNNFTAHVAWELHRIDSRWGRVFKRNNSICDDRDCDKILYLNGQQTYMVDIVGACELSRHSRTWQTHHPRDIPKTLEMWREPECKFSCDGHEEPPPPPDDEEPEPDVIELERLAKLLSVIIEQQLLIIQRLDAQTEALVKATEELRVQLDRGIRIRPF